MTEPEDARGPGHDGGEDPAEPAVVPPDAVAELYARFPYPPAEPGGRARKRKTQGAVAEGREIAAALLASDPRVASGRILDAGCGTGLKLLGLAKALPGASLIGVDVSRASLETALRVLEEGGASNAKLVHADLSRDASELPGAPFDALVCDGVLHHLRDPEGALRGLAGLLRPGAPAWITLFGKYGRAEAGRLRLMINLWNPRFLDFERRLEAARGFLRATELGSRRHAANFEDDAFLADALLNPREAWYDWVSARRLAEGAGLALESWVDGERYWKELAGRLRAAGLDPEARTEPLSTSDRMRLVELWKGPGMLRLIARKPAAEAVRGGEGGGDTEGNG
jgi:SAM-dependent methyltransferase